MNFYGELFIHPQIYLFLPPKVSSSPKYFLVIRDLHFQVHYWTFSITQQTYANLFMLKKKKKSSFNSCHNLPTVHFSPTFYQISERNNTFLLLVLKNYSKELKTFSILFSGFKARHSWVEIFILPLPISRLNFLICKKGNSTYMILLTVSPQ